MPISLESTRTITFDTVNESLRWEVFAFFETTIEDYYIETIFPYDETWMEFMRFYHDKSMHHIFMNFHPDDIVLTLSTCATEKDGRVVLMARLVK